jgi:hypothetical protein
MLTELSRLVQKLSEDEAELCTSLLGMSEEAVGFTERHHAI